MGLPVLAHFFILAGIYFGFLVIIVIFSFSRNWGSKNNLFLGLSLFSIWYALAITNLNESQEILKYPFLLRTGIITAYLILLFLYLFVRNSYYPGKLWEWKSSWVFLPVLFYLIDYLPFFLGNRHQKTSIMTENLQDRYKMFSFAEGWITPRGFQFIFLYSWSLLILILIVQLIYRNRYLFHRSEEKQNRPLAYFILGITLIYVPLIIPAIIGVLFQMNWYSLSFLDVNLALVNLVAVLFLLFKPGVMYGFIPSVNTAGNSKNSLAKALISGEITQTVSGTSSKAAGKKSPLRFLDEKEQERIFHIIDQLVHEKRLFLNHRYSIHDLSLDSGFPVYQLSPLINQKAGTNFNNWLNQYRVEHFLKLCRDERSKDLTMDGLAYESGFSNRATFIRAFKKVKGSTPGAYLK